MQLVCLKEKIVLLLNLCYSDVARGFLPDPTLLVEEMPNTRNSINIASGESSAVSLAANLLLWSLPFTSDKLSCVTSVVI